MSKKGWETHPKVREGSGGTPGGLEGVSRPSRWAGRSPKALPEVWAAHPKVQGVSREPSEGLGGGGRPTWRSGSCREAHLEVREGLGGPLGGPGVVGSPTR